ncbi:MAG: hypothetical protein K0B52_01150 [FCB group bacterium]|nr:hypothetical protein [FCB group bacterium]
MIWGGVNDLQTVASLGINAYAFLTDVYYLGISSTLPNKIEPFFSAFQQTCWSFMLTIWPHEFGHWTRARQVGGEFVFVKFGIPWPDARMDLPDNIDLFSEALTSVGGFEINNLMRKMIMDDYYSRDYSYASLGVHAFIQQIYYPAYAFIVAPLVSGKWIDPRDPDTWIHTMGDPVESIQLSYRNYSGISVPEEGQDVDPGLVSFYRETLIMSLIWMFIDPGFYEGLHAFGVGMDNNSGLMRPRLFGNEKYAWMFGTMFNASPLGYELYFNNHLRLNGKYFNTSFRYGRPFDNIGLSVSVPSLYETPMLRLGAEAGYWYQGPFGHGIMTELNGLIRFSYTFRVIFRVGWKSQGYVLGLPIEQTMYVRGGMSIHVNWH